MSKTTAKPAPKLSAGGLKPIEQDALYDVDEILASKSNRGKMYYLVKWSGYGNEDNTWEPYENVRGCIAYQSYAQQQRARALQTDRAVTERDKHAAYDVTQQKSGKTVQRIAADTTSSAVKPATARTHTSATAAQAKNKYSNTGASVLKFATVKSKPIRSTDTAIMLEKTATKASDSSKHSGTNDNDAKQQSPVLASTTSASPAIQDKTLSPPAIKPLKSATAVASSSGTTAAAAPAATAVTEPTSAHHNTRNSPRANKRTIPPDTALVSSSSSSAQKPARNIPRLIDKMSSANSAPPNTATPNKSPPIDWSNDVEIIDFTQSAQQDDDVVISDTAPVKPVDMNTLHNSSTLWAGKFTVVEPELTEHTIDVQCKYLCGYKLRRLQLHQFVDVDRKRISVASAQQWLYAQQKQRQYHISCVMFDVTSAAEADKYARLEQYYGVHARQRLLCMDNLKAADARKEYLIYVVPPKMYTLFSTAFLSDMLKLSIERYREVLETKFWGIVMLTEAAYNACTQIDNNNSDSTHTATAADGHSGSTATSNTTDLSAMLQSISQYIQPAGAATQYGYQTSPILPPLPPADQLPAYHTVQYTQPMQYTQPANGAYHQYPNVQMQPYLTLYGYQTYQ